MELGERGIRKTHQVNCANERRLLDNLLEIMKIRCPSVLKSTVKRSNSYTENWLMPILDDYVLYRFISEACDLRSLED